MSKIVQAVNAMIANPEKITNVIEGTDEIFFVYKDQYKWSITKRNDDYLLWFYPKDVDIEYLATFDGDDWEQHNVTMVTYRSADIGTKEATASFSELYTLVKERVFGVNAVLDDIISDDIPF